MPLVFDKKLVRFEGICMVEDAVSLIEHLRHHRAAQVDLSDCSYLHSALLQLLMVAKPKVVVPPNDTFLARWVAPLLIPAKGAR